MIDRRPGRALTTNRREAIEVEPEGTRRREARLHRRAGIDRAGVRRAREERLPASSASGPYLGDDTVEERVGEDLDRFGLQFEREVALASERGQQHVRHRMQRHRLDARQLRRRRVHDDDRGDAGRCEQLAESNGLALQCGLDGVQDDVAGARVGGR